MVDGDNTKCEPASSPIHLEQYRDYLTVLARAHLESNLRAKVSASDIVQHTFLKAHRARAQVRDRNPANVAAWLRRFAAAQLPARVLTG